MRPKFTLGNKSVSLHLRYETSATTARAVAMSMSAVTERRRDLIRSSDRMLGAFAAVREMLAQESAYRPTRRGLTRLSREFLAYTRKLAAVGDDLDVDPQRRGP
jgi:hypothetical protein